MKNELIASLPVILLACALPAETKIEVDPDLPKEKPAEAKTSYYHDDADGTITAYWGLYSGLLTHKWLDAPHDGEEPISQAKQDAISDDYIRRCKEKKDYASLARALIYRERWDEAISAFKAYHDQQIKGRDGDQGRAEALHGIAEAHLGAGRFEVAKQMYHDLAHTNLAWGGYYNGGKSTYPNYVDLAARQLHWMEGRRLDGLGLPKCNDLKPFPTPQEAEYTETFKSCPTISVFLRDVDEDDPRIWLLKMKLEKRGFKVNMGSEKWKIWKAKNEGYPVAIALAEKAIDKPEGYTLKATDEKCVIKGHDKQGVLWGIVSFLQILDPEKHTIRLQTIRDWPACPKRGFLGNCCQHDAEFLVFNKMNINTAKPNYLSGADFGPLNMYMAKEMGKDHNDFGLELYYGMASVTMNLTWPISWRIFGAMQIDIFSKVASCGIGVYYPYDDARYWESVAYHKEDEVIGKPSDYDMPHIKRVYDGVKAKYPDFKMQFCPPFYWGPTVGSPYPDDRDKYLENIGKILPKEISIFWTGERVGSLTKSDRCVEWFTKLIGRKPSLFQNKAGRHFYQSYGPDPMPWDEWYYDGFVDRDMRSIQKNGNTPSDYTILTSLADFCWNPKAYDRERAIGRGLNNLAGKGIYEIMKPAHDAIVKTDRYKYGYIDSGILNEDKDAWERNDKLVTAASEKVKEVAGEYFYKNCLGSWEKAVQIHHNLNWWVHNPPNYAEKYKIGIENSLKDFAALQPNHEFDPQHDLKFAALDFRGGQCRFVPNKDKRTGQIPVPESRLAVRLDYDVATEAHFTLDRVPEKGIDMRLGGFAMWPADSLTILVNDHVKLDGKQRNNPLVRYEKGLSVANSIIPKEMLKKGENVIVFKNISPAKYPIVIHFLVLKGVR